MKMNLRKRGISLFLAIAICFTLAPMIPAKEADATSKYISVGLFCRFLAKELGVSPLNGSTNMAYVNALIEKGLIKDSDFTSYTDWLTRGDALVLLSRADEFLYGDTLDAVLVQTTLEKRISDITKVTESKRTDVAKGYLKGFLKGSSNGLYSTDRELKVNAKITRAGSLSCIKMLKDKSKRAKISPDGQLIRTTNLPKYAKNYPYILSSYPNAYYDWKFFYEDVTRSTYNETTGKMEKKPYVYLEEYASPADVDKTTRIENFPEVKKELLDTWVNKATTHMECIFNVDYRTIDEEWIDKMASADYTYGYWGMEDQTRINLEKYIEKVKKNKTIIESKKIATDGSSLYYFDGRYYLRFYVKYRIVSSSKNYETGEYYEFKDNNLFYTTWPICLNKKAKISEWRECYFDVELTNYTKEERQNLGAFCALIVEPYYTKGKIK